MLTIGSRHKAFKCKVLKMLLRPGLVPGFLFCARLVDERDIASRFMGSPIETRGPRFVVANAV